MHLKIPYTKILTNENVLVITISSLLIKGILNMKTVITK